MIKKLDVSDIAQITKIHISALKGDFLPSLGESFLQAFYKGIINDNNIYGFAELKNKKIVGFIIGTNDMSKFLMSGIKNNFIDLSVSLFIQILKNPKIVFNIFETFLYPNKETGPKAELVIIAVDAKSHGKGIGKKLVKTLEEKFKIEKIKKYKLTVHKNKPAVKFYKKLGFKKISDFFLYQKEWSIYEKRI